MAVGRLPGAAPRGRRGRHLPRARPRPAQGDLRQRGDGRDVRQGHRLQPRAGRLDAPLRRRHPVLRRQRHRRGRAAAGRGPGAGRPPARRAARHRLLLRRRRRGRGGVPRVDEPGLAVAAAGALRLREQPLRHGHRHRAAPGPARPAAQGPRATRVPAESVDGMDVLAVEAAARRAADQVRSGQGPFFLEARTYRFRAHSAYDPELYRTKEEVERWKQRDPIPALAAALRASGHLDDARQARLEGAAREVDEAVALRRGLAVGAGRGPAPRRGGRAGRRGRRP